MRSGLRVQRVVLAYLLLSVVEIAVWVTVMLYAYERGGAAQAGVASSLSLVPAMVLAPLLGSVGDRFPRGTALVGAYAVTAVVVGVLAVLLHAEASVWTIVAGAAAVTTCIALARPLHYASMPALAPTPEALVWANSATAFATGIGGFAGPALAGLAAATLGPWSLAATSAVALLIASGLCVRLDLPSPADGEKLEGPIREAMAGIRHVGKDASVLAVLALAGITYISLGAIEILGISFGATVLKVDESGQGLLVGAAGLGSLGGALLGAGLAYRKRLAPAVVLGLVAAGVPLVFVGGASSLVLAVVFIAVFGIGERFSSLAAETLMQRATDDAVLARVFAVWEAVMLLGYAIGTISAPALIQWRGEAGAYLPLGLGLAVLALALWPLLHPLDARAIFRTDVLALFRGIPFLNAMRPAALDRLSNNADWEDLEAGQVVIEEGDIGDSYYVVQEGTLSVTQGGSDLRLLGPGDGFGEVALLLDMPRSATITALEPTRVVVVERDEFLAAVMRSPDGRRIAMRVAAAHVGHPAGGGRRRRHRPTA